MYPANNINVNSFISIYSAVVCPPVPKPSSGVVNFGTAEIGYMEDTVLAPSYTMHVMEDGEYHLVGRKELARNQGIGMGILQYAQEVNTFNTGVILDIQTKLFKTHKNLYYCAICSMYYYFCDTPCSFTFEVFDTT